LLGIGRYQFGLGTVVSSRYQYLAWIGFAPCLGIVLDSIIRAIADRLGGTKRAARVVTAVVLASLVGFVAIPWPMEADRWAEWRGTAIRDELRAAPGNNRLSYGLVTVDRARELADRFELH
jgi:hypothetical protein